VIQRLAPLYIWRAIVALLSLEVAAAAVLRYFTPFDPPPEVILANAFAGPVLVTHVVAGVVALLLGPLQFVAGLRMRWPVAHRLGGRIFVAASLVVGPSGLLLAIGTSAGPVAAVGFAIPGLLLPPFVIFGWRAAVERRVEAHRAWMLRAYALVAAAITLRVMLPASGWLGYHFLAAYRVISWASWATNLALAEWWLRRGRGAARQIAQPAVVLV
jgi:hypothetical protein